MSRVSNLDARRHIELVVESAKMHPGQWTILAKQVPTSRGRAYSRRGCEVAYRNQRVPGIADILIRWPDHRRPVGQQDDRQA